MNTHLSDDFCLYRSQFGYPYPGLFNPLRCNYEYALTGSDNEGTKKQEETKKRREKKRMSQLMYSDTRRQRLNERLRLKLENRKTNENDSKTKNKTDDNCLSEQDLLSLFETNDVKETKKKKKKKKKRKKKDREKVALKKEEMELLEEEILGTSSSIVATLTTPEEKQETVEICEDAKKDSEEVVLQMDCEHSSDSTPVDVTLSTTQDVEKEASLKTAESAKIESDDNNDIIISTEEDAEKSCGETNSIESAGNVTERGSLSVEVEKHQEPDVNCLGPDEFDPAWLLFISDHEREDEKPDDGDGGFIVVKRKEKRPKPQKKSNRPYRKRARRRRDREGRNGRRRRQRNTTTDDRKIEKSPKNNNNKPNASPNVINSCPIKHISSNRQQPIFIPQPHKTQAPSLPSIIKEEKEKEREKLSEHEPTPSESETTQYFIMPIPEIPEPRTHQEKCDPTLIQQDYSSPQHSASTSKSPSPTRPPPGFETNNVPPPVPTLQQVPAPMPQNVNVQHYQQVNPQLNTTQPNPQMLNMIHYPQQPVNFEQQQPQQVMMAPPNHMNPAMSPEVPLSKPFHYQQCDSVMYLYLPSEQVLKIPMCPEERCAEEKYRMNLDLSYPVNPSEMPQQPPTYYLPVMSPVQQNGVFMYPEQGNMMPAPQPPSPHDAAPYMVPADPSYVPYMNPEAAIPHPEMYTPMMYPQ